MHYYALLKWERNFLYLLSWVIKCRTASLKLKNKAPHSFPSLPMYLHFIWATPPSYVISSIGLNSTGISGRLLLLILLITVRRRILINHPLMRAITLKHLLISYLLVK